MFTLFFVNQCPYTDLFSFNNKKIQDELKRVGYRDCSKALAVCKLILQYMPDFDINKLDLRMFSEDILTDAIQVLDGSGIPPGYGG